MSPINPNTQDPPPIDYIRRIQGIKYAIFVKEVSKDPNSYNVSLRSRDLNFDVARIAKLYGGGGHKTAAGFALKTDKTIEEVIKEIICIA